MKKTYQTLCIFSFISLLTGCGITGGYNLDPSLPHAKIGVINNHDESSNAFFLSENNDTCTPSEVVNTRSGPISINANRAISFMIYHQLAGYNTIYLGGTFVPKPNHIYWIKVTDDIHGAYEIPNMQLLDQLTKDGKPYYQAVPFIARKTKLVFFLSNVSCVSPIKEST